MIILVYICRDGPTGGAKGPAPRVKEKKEKKNLGPPNPKKKNEKILFNSYILIYLFLELCLILPKT